jgi:hypothetical protein
MPRTLPAALTTVMDAGIYEPYLRVIVNNQPNDTGAATVQPMAFTLTALNASVKIAKFSNDIAEYSYFRLVRGALIDGTPSTISSIWFLATDITYDGKFAHLTGDALEPNAAAADPNGTYQDVIEEIISELHGPPTAIEYEGTAAWKSYQFYPNGATPLFSPAKKIFSLLKQKYLVFACEDGWDDVNLKNKYFFFCAPQARTTDYAFTDLLFHGNERAENRRLIFKDELDAVHTQGSTSLATYNLGFLPSTADFPAAVPINFYVGARSSKLPVHLKYRTGDHATCAGDGSGLNELDARINVIEVLDLGSTPAWYQIIETLVWFGKTEAVGELDERPIPLTNKLFKPIIKDEVPIEFSPLRTGHFVSALSSFDSNIQTAFETLDRHSHAGEVTNGNSHDHAGGDGAQIAYSGLSGLPTLREVLTAARTYYVRTDGSDGNTGLANTAGGAFLTIQKAYDVACTLDMGGYTVTIQIGDGTYTGGLLINKPWIGGNITVQGNSGTPANVVISTSEDCIACTVAIPGIFIIKDMKLTSSASVCIAHFGIGTLQFGNLNFGSATAAYHIGAFTTGASVNAISNYTISGGASIHWACVGGGRIEAAGLTITLTGTPAFSYKFAVVTQGLGNIRCSSNTFSGSATGARYIIDSNGVIFTNGAGATYLPGDAAGSVGTGGQYV